MNDYRPLPSPRWDPSGRYLGDYTDAEWTPEREAQVIAQRDEADARNLAFLRASGRLLNS